MAVREKRAKSSSKPQPVHPGGRRMRLLGIVILSILGPLAAVIMGLAIYFTGGRFVSTDNAYIKSEKIAVSADISGRVIEVSVRENQLLGKGAPMFRIDPEPFEIALEMAQARLIFARQEIAALRALHKQKLAELKLAEGDLGFYERQLERQKTLSRRGFSSEIKMDEATRNQRNARDRISTVMQDIAQVSAKLGGGPDIATASHPSVREARAARDAAALDLRRTAVPAPVNGVVTNFDLQPGEYIAAGKVVFSLVGTGDVWVDANFKETDLTHVRAGQPATIRVDAYPDEIRKAVVASISPATGAEFALLPPQNSTGNWVKVVQRLPVRIKLENPLSDPPLRAGMSVVVEIDTGHKRAMPDLARAALNWARDLI
ncbi:MAG: HlyD family secretion protein [Proteobacteria bacterium]|nr:HlyD family secretion protein [Pseudomonadota bacterium]